MHSLRLGQGLAAALTISVLLLMASLFGFGVAIQQRTIAPPTLDVQLGEVQLVGYATHMPDCDPWYVTACPPDFIASGKQDFYVIWISTRTGQLVYPGERQTATRLLRLPLHN